MTHEIQVRVRYRRESSGSLVYCIECARRPGARELQEIVAARLAHDPDLMTPAIHERAVAVELCEWELL